MESFSALLFKSSLFLLIQLLHPSSRALQFFCESAEHPILLQCPQEGAQHARQQGQCLFIAIDQANFVKVHLAIYTSMIQMRQCIKH